MATATKTKTKIKAAFDGKAAAAAIRHLEGCPADADRVESYSAIRPATNEAPRSTVYVTRCMDCGGSRVDGSPPAWAPALEGDS